MLLQSLFLKHTFAEIEFFQEDESAKILEKSMKSKDVSPTGRVVAIVRRKWRQYCGILQLNPVAGSIRQIFVPAEKKIPKIRIETRQINLLFGQRIIVAVDAWPRTSRYPVINIQGNGRHFTKDILSFLYY